MIAEALAFVSPSDRDTWVKMAMAVKDELGENGFELWDGWSRNANNYNQHSARSVWRSVSPGGGITIGTLYAEARQAGWRGQGSSLDPIPSPKRKAARDTHNQSEERSHQQAAQQAQTMLDKAYLSPHDYLARKGFPTESGFVLDGMLLVPMRNLRTGELLSLQTITASGEKRFLKGGKAGGSAHALGSIHEESYLCEGLATALSIKAALKILYRNACVVVCFSAANIVKVAQEFDAYVIADHDENGTGQRYAEKTGLPWWMPPDIGDANDYHQNCGVRALAEAINRLRSVQTGERHLG